MYRRQVQKTNRSGPFCVIPDRPDLIWKTWPNRFTKTDRMRDGVPNAVLHATRIDRTVLAAHASIAWSINALEVRGGMSMTTLASARMRTASGRNQSTASGVTCKLARTGSSKSEKPSGETVSTSLEIGRSRHGVAKIVIEMSSSLDIP